VIDQSSNGTFVTVEGEPEVQLRREEMFLRESGHISFGHAYEADPVETLVFNFIAGDAWAAKTSGVALRGSATIRLSVFQRRRVLDHALLAAERCAVESRRWIRLEPRYDRRVRAGACRTSPSPLSPLVAPSMKHACPSIALSGFNTPTATRSPADPLPDNCSA
jgi:hypothetical protein